MNYQEARKYIDDAWQYAGNMELSAIRNLLEMLGDPQNDLQFVHIAGTNGKGSVASYIASILEHAGYRIGRYVSPTVYSYRERIQINGIYISREEFAGYVTKLEPFVAQMAEEGKGHLTPFELETVISFLYFRDQKCDLVLLECGMGGKTDATNVITNTRMAVLTSISLDHVGILGNDLISIAKNKAGIIKPGSVVVMGRQQPEVEETIWAICTEHEYQLVEAKPQEAVIRESTIEKQTFRYHGKEITIHLAGSHQIDNAVLALECVQALRLFGFRIMEKDITDGFQQTKWEGRFTVLDEAPYFIVDGAHNPEAAMRLKQSVETYFPDKRLIFIMGMFQDKDYEKVAEITAGMAQRIFTVTPPDPTRGLPAAQLAEAIEPYNTAVAPCQSFAHAVECAYAAAGSQDVILSFGSLSFIGEMTKIIQERKKKKEEEKAENGEMLC